MSARGVFMATFSERFRELRKEKHITLDIIAGVLKTTKTTLSRYENNLRVPNIDFVKDAANYFGVQADYLLGRSDIRYNNLIYDAFQKKTVDLPIISIVRESEPLYAEKNILGYSSIDVNLVPSGECYYLKVKGDSMNLSHIVDGQLIIIRRQEEVENGEIALVLVNGEDAAIKRFYKTDTIVTLMPHSSNQEHQPRIIDLRKENVKVIGKVVGTFINFHYT
jgi:repressor LexA